MRYLVLGLGNLLMGDDGLGVRAVERLHAAHSLPEQVEVIDGGTMGLELLPYVEGAAALLIVDAVRTGRPPGTRVRLSGDEIPAAIGCKFSLHQAGLEELLAACRLRGTLPARVVLWGIEPAVVDWGTELSPPVAAALDDLIADVVRELWHWAGNGQPNANPGNGSHPQD